ncbi:DoxX family protein [Rhodococcus ruber]|uniref:DoxX family protein n=1 Tax=Rhodococcus ruber TaxID=1830 RepID=UPI001781189E|nr:DoxX family protein [Rhodococcus ruber]MBD8056042.1 DoxX family protein [Rhodococcus ruber]QRE79372.1 DoxX family protein [Rhodococcus ruber]
MISTTTRPAERPTDRKFRIAGLVITGLVVLFLLFDAAIHVLNVDQARQAMIDLGFDPNLNYVIGVVMLVCLALYLVPVTSILGAVLLTGYLGGAVATNMFNEMPLFSTILFPVYVGVFVWAGLYLRDPVVRSVMPLRRG